VRAQQRERSPAAVLRPRAPEFIDRAEGKREPALQKINELLGKYDRFLDSEEPDRNSLHVLKTERALLLAEGGDYENALPELWAALSWGYAKAQVCFYIARGLLENGDYADARTQYEAVLNDPSLPNIYVAQTHYGLAFAFAKLSQYELVIEQLNLLEKLPTTPHVCRQFAYEVWSNCLEALGLKEEAMHYFQLSKRF
jgi:tetratricopeptide (TPR) repeat protein